MKIFDRLQIQVSDLRLWPGLMAFFLALIWLQPHHIPPWSGFHEDAGAALWMLVGAWALTLLRTRTWSWTWPPICFAALSVWVAGQAVMGLISSSGQALLFLGHLWACALCWVLVENDGKQDPYLFLDVFFLALGISSIANIAVGLHQWLQIMPEDILSTSGVWLMNAGNMPRAIGNIAQPNEFATMIVWSLLGGIWGVHRGVLRWAGFMAYALFLALGLALTQSRAGMLQLFFLCFGLAFYRKSIGGWRPALALFFVGVIQVLIFLSLPWWVDVLGLSHNVRQVGDAVSKDVARLNIYAMAIDAIGQSPWWGYGAQHFSIAQWRVVDAQPWLHAFYMQAHNWVLDLLLWFGLPLGLLLFALVVFWFYRALRCVQRPEHVVALLAVLCFMIHASVELPHWISNLLLPTVVLAAGLHTSLAQKVVWRSGLMFNILILSLASCLLVLSIVDYLRLERNFTQLRAEQLRMRTDISEVPEPWVLSHLAQSFRVARTNPSPNMSSEDLQWYEQTVYATPVNQTIYQYIVALSLNHRHDEARLWMKRLSAVSPENYQERYASVWRRHQARYPSETAGLAWESGKK